MARRTRRRARRATPSAGVSAFRTTEDMVRATGLSREALWRARREGGLEAGIHYVRIGRRLLWHLANFQRWQQQLDGAQDADNIRHGSGGTPGAAGDEPPVKAGRGEA